MAKKVTPTVPGPAATSGTPSHSSHSTGIIIAVVRIQNFRCLREAEVSLGPLSVLIGENNAGKTSFLEALYAAIGAGPRQLTEDDIWTQDNEKQAPKSRSVIIDVRIEPTDASGKTATLFPAGSPWLELWGNGVVQGDAGEDFVAIRTTLHWSSVKQEYVLERRFLKEWPVNVKDMATAQFVQKNPPVTTAQISPMSMYLLDAKRDGAEDLRQRGSIWHKLISEPGLEEQDIKDIEDKLTDINDLFVNKSGVLTHVQDHLSRVGDVVNCDKDKVSVTPVARRLRDLNKGMDVLLSTSGASSFPLARQGMGTRSLASVLLFRAYMSWRQQSKHREALHPMVAIEEPESHLHPHAQRSLFSQIEAIPGQRIISTHSPYICSQTDVASFIHFQKNGNESRISRFYDDPSHGPLTTEEIRRINREVMHTRGDLLFSRAIILFEGETEEQAIPSFAHLYWNSHPNELGVSLVGVKGAGNYTPFLRMAKRLRIPWFILSDGEADAIAKVNGCLSRVGEANIPNNPRVIVVGLDQDFEGYLVQSPRIDAIKEMIVQFHVDRGTLNEQATNAKRATVQGWTIDQVLAELDREKTGYGSRIASALDSITDPTQRIPEKIRELLDLVKPRTVSAKVAAGSAIVEEKESSNES